MSCRCDPSLSGSFTDCDGCIYYDIGVIVSYAVLFSYTLVVFVYCLREKITLVSVRNLVLLLLLSVSILRIIRYAILISLNPFSQVTEGLGIFLDILYGIVFLIGFSAWCLIILSWIRMYVLLKNPTTQKLTMGNILSWRWLATFSIMCIIIGIGWFVVIIINSYYAISFLLNGYTAAVIVLLVIIFLTSGCLFTNHLKIAASVNLMRQNSWKRINRFVMIISIAFLVDVITLVITSAITEFVVDSLDWFLARNSIYKIAEQLPIYVMVTMFKPSWKKFLCRDLVPSYTYALGSETTTKMEEMEEAINKS